ncbi:uncharacterized protein LOC115453548 [Manduca sexta]|uniref:Uncharacterized protein n=1 Tax=Manduca sexta TaxID=7130 RepID=A0A922D072_MANSE|nr:uncharacterized protein LOC115453548 [Manduca sexta]XP_037297474.1 uncharacterized protein LOC115453548 [Manduca sexta]KAG6465064.1 hypothetical protein O3G_MSEX014917 [Manduca sexta]KAG6465065.1 hypothetical protein O3G_MSEX014917 [Manduca sexta]
MTKEPMLSYRKCILINRDMDSDTDVEICSSDEEGVKLNIHQELLSKPEREQITWATHYLQPEREDEKTLVKKADDLTDRIAKDFCDYMKELGGDQQSQLFTPEAIKELFRIEFDNHAARGLRVISKELPSIQEKVAINTGNPEKSCYRALEREISKDIKAEHLPKRTTAFGQSLLLREQFYPPRNNTKCMWRSARHVPKELVTLKTVWEGITNLRSVKEFCRWMIEHPEYRRPSYLNCLGMFDPAMLDARITLETKYRISSTAPVEPPLPVDHIRRRLSELADS